MNPTEYVSIVYELFAATICLATVAAIAHRSNQ